jgi:hypothetical protein
MSHISQGETCTVVLYIVGFVITPQYTLSLLEVLLSSVLLHERHSAEVSLLEWFIRGLSNPAKYLYFTQNYWVFGLFPSSAILGTRKHDVSKTDPVSEICVF